MTIKFSGLNETADLSDSCPSISPVEAVSDLQTVDYSNNWSTTICAFIVCLILTVLNMVFLIQIALGKEV